MISKNAKQMLQTALRNAIPMHRLGYTAVSTGFMPAAKPYIVTKPGRDENGNVVRYTVALNPQTCDCEYFLKHREAGFQLGECTCKHIEFARSVDEENARIDAMVEAQDAEELYRMDYCNLRTVATAERLYQDACHTHR
jgi:hypothetical protein